MGLYLYCVVEAGHPEPVGVEGIDGGGVRSLHTAGLHVWVSPLATSPGASLERVRAHNAVVERAMENATPVPLRFGHWFRSEPEMQAVLEDRRDSLERSLERVRGAAEIGVRVLDAERSEPPAPDRTSGRAYMEALARRAQRVDRSRRRAAEVAAELRAFLGPLVRDQVVRPGGADSLAAIAHLVARHDTGTYRDQVHAFIDRYHSDLRFVVSGPWPPYGFVDDGSGRGGADAG